MTVVFKQLVEEIVRQIPYGRVMTYGQIAALCGSPRAARIVGGIAHFGDPNLPWHRVVNKHGGTAVGYPGGREAHAEMLASEGLVMSDAQHVDVTTIIWWPDGR